MIIEELYPYINQMFRIEGSILIIENIFDKKLNIFQNNQHSIINFDSDSLDFCFNCNKITRGLIIHAIFNKKTSSIEFCYRCNKFKNPQYIEELKNEISKNHL